MGTTRLIVGLGNPGREYARTRHNAGFMVLDCLGKRWTARWGMESRFRCRLAKIDQAGTRFLLCQPETFMNLSGEAVAPLMRFFRVDPKELVVVVDDADLPLGNLRLRPGGSSGGHHGLDSIEAHLGSKQFARLRVGIGRTDSAVREITKHVLSQFETPEEKVLEKVLDRACDQLECWATDGLETAMNRFNGLVKT